MFCAAGLFLILNLYWTLGRHSLSSSYSLSSTTYISLFLNTTLGGCLLRQACHPQGTLLLSGRIPQISFLWVLAGAVADTELFGVCVGLFWGVGHCSWFRLACLGLGDLFSLSLSYWPYYHLCLSLSLLVCWSFLDIGSLIWEVDLNF